MQADRTTTGPADAVPLPDPARQRAVIATLAFAGMGASFMQTILLPIQGELPRLLSAEPDATAWVITITLLAAAISTPIAGRLGDMFGKRRIAILLTWTLVAGSLICAASSNIFVVYLGRALQGLGMGIIPLGISLLRDLVARERLGTAIALVSATLGVGGAIGLPISALVVEYLDWHMLFILSALFSGIAAIAMTVVVPSTFVRSGGRVDLVGALGLAVGLVGVLLAISQGNAWGWGSVPTLASAIIGLATLVLWARFEWRVDNPLVDLRISTRPAVLMTNLASIAMGFALFSSNIAFPQLLALAPESGGMGLDLITASLVLMPAGLAMLAMSPVAGRIERTTGPRPLLVAGALVLTLAYLGCTLIELSLWHVALANTVIGIGIGLGYAAMPALIMAAVPRNETGAANGLNTLMRSFGTTTASAVVGAVLAASAGANQSGAFTMIFALGLAAAAACAVLAFFIPKPQPEPTAVATV